MLLLKAELHSPANPIISSDLGWIAFINLLLSIAAAYIWNLYKSKLASKQERYDGVQTGYRYSVVGQLLKYFVIFSTTVPFVFIAVHTYDTAGCNRKDLVPYWNYRALVFISLWLECFFICFFYRSTRSLFKQFFLVPCDLSEADFVSIWQKMSKESDVTSKKQTKLSNFLSIFLDPFNKLSKILNDEVSGYILSTVPIHRDTELDGDSKPYFELFCVRYWYSETLNKFTSMEDQRCSESGELSNITACLGKDVYNIPSVSGLDQLKPSPEGSKLVFSSLEDLDPGVGTVETLSPILGLREEQAREQRQSYGRNYIKIEMPSLFYGLLSELMDPLTVFQLLVVASYTFQGYVLFAIKWVPMMIVSIFANIRTHFTNIKNVRKLAEVTGCDTVKVVRDGRIVALSSSELVPGDIIHIYEDSVVPCDLLLLSGSAVVNESMLTGESAEVLKMPISECESEKISPEDGPYSGKRYFLYAGTHITAVYNNVGKGITLGGSLGSLNVKTSSTRSTDSMVNFISGSDLSEISGAQRLASEESPSATTALVIRTGISTLRGKIIRSILYPSKYSFGLYDQLPIAWLCLSVIVAFIIFKQGKSFSWSLFTFFFALGSMNSTFPLYLGVLNTLSQNVSSKRLLKNSNVKALIPTRIMLAGKLRIMCFDKTGTLTNDHLDFIGMSPIYTLGDDEETDHLTCASACRAESSDSGGSSELASQTASYVLSDKVCNIDEIRDKLKLAFLSIRSCTSLSHSPTNFGIPRDVITNPREYYERMNGNDTDKALFSITNSFFEKNPTTERVYIHSVHLRHGDGEKDLDIADSSLEVLRIFPFDYNKRLMSVIVHCKHNDEYYLFTKGAPESIQRIYVGQIGSEFKHRLDDLSSQGYYLIMSGYKKIEKNLLNLYLALNRNDIETELMPLGLFLFENTVREEARSVLRQLVDSDVLPVVVTGDSPLTGLNAALKLGIIDETYGKTAVSELYTSKTGSSSVIWRCTRSKQLVADSEIYTRNSKFGNLVLTGDCFGLLLKEHHSSVFFSDLQDKDRGEELDLEATGGLLQGKTKMDHIINRIGVYARMSPSNKVEVVSLFMKRGVITGMVGDGGNDCGALRISHVGLSFSKGDASLVAPFNSSTSDLNSVLEIIREGRSSLASAMSILLYLISYGIMTSLSETLLTHFAFAAVPDISSSFVAFFAQTLLLIGLLFNSPCRRLAAARPFGSIASVRFILAFVTPITTYVIGYFVMISRLSSKSWFQFSKDFNSKLPAQNWFMRMDNVESTCSWIYTAVQIIATAICYTMGSQFRSPFYKNPFILVPICINAIVYSVLVFTGPNSFTCMFRVNCDSVNIQKAAIKIFGITVINPSSRPFSGPNGSNIMPFSWRVEFAAICILTMLFAISLFSVITKHREGRKTSVERQF